jgi:prepilin-type N-terminal cleavage/methylation domain-containing protein
MNPTKQKHFTSNPRTFGYTLIELLVVITIIATLTAISFPIYSGIKNSNRKKVASAQIRLFTLKLNDFRLDYGFLPKATFIEGTPPLSITKPGIYPPDPDTDAYRKSSRVLFLALTGRPVYDKPDESTGRDYLKPVKKEVKDPEAGPSGSTLFADEQKTYSENSFSSGSYLIDPWGNPYGFYHNPDNNKYKSYNSPSSFDIWSTSGEIEDTPKSLRKWVTSWKSSR